MPKSNAQQTAAPQPTLPRVRCLNCGTSGPAGGDCPACLLPLLSKEEYEEKLRRYKEVKTIERNQNPGRIVLIFLLFIGMGVLLYFLLSILGNEILFGTVTMASFFSWIFYAFGFIFLFVELGSRAFRIRRTRMTRAQYRTMLKELKNLPAGLVPGAGRPPKAVAAQTPADSKKSDKKYNRALAAILIPLFLIVGYMGYNYAVKYGGMDAISLGGGGTLNGRCQATSGGDYDPVIIFRDGKAYFGVICFSDDEIVEDVGGVHQSSDRNGVTYTLTSTSITFNSNTGVSKTYERDGDTIYFGSATMVKVPPKG